MDVTKSKLSLATLGNWQIITVNFYMKEMKIALFLDK